MAELGNILFDRCGGGYEIVRGVGFEEELTRLFDAVAPERNTEWRDYGPSFENNTFQIWPYSWCNCDCGYDEIEAGWSKHNKHRDDCYQSLRDGAMREWDAMHDYNTVKAWSMHEKWCAVYDKRNRFERNISRELCKRFRIRWNKGWGSAVHCTCDFEKRWAVFRESHVHDPRCQVARKSFLFKPTGFWIDWYKYPLRDAHASAKIGLRDFVQLVDECIRSLAEDKGGPVIVLETNNEDERGQTK